jgi:succinate dehydrogenase/fumarate reductase-like Fe-S protein
MRRGICHSWRCSTNSTRTSSTEPPVAFEHDCREGICGSCGFLINGVAHGGHRGTTVCQLSMRFFKDGNSVTLEPWRARAFPVIRGLIVSRSVFDRVIQARGFISAPTSSAPDANAILIAKEAADTAFDAAACLGCGACVAACPNAAAIALHLSQTHSPQRASSGSASARPANRQYGGRDEGRTLRQSHESWRV